MITNKVLVFCAATALIASVVAAGCSRSPQAREARFLKRGKELAAKKDFGRALLEFKSAAQAMPKDAEPYYQLGLTYLVLRDPVCRRCLQESRRVGPEASRRAIETGGDGGEHPESGSARRRHDPATGDCGLLAR